MYAYIDLANIARTDSRIQSLSWMNCNSLSEGWLATGNTNHIVSVTYTSLKSNEICSLPDRTNFNLRAHRTDVRFISWNIPYQKLATVDEKGVIFVWIKNENRWSLELINDRSHSVIDMSWSYDGRMTVICYEDNFILVGSVTGQRFWSTVLNLPQDKISAVTWTPDISNVIVGTTSGQLIIIDHHGNTQEILSITTQSIRQLMYSCQKFYPEAPDANATKFVNDDYILACTLENGRILLMNTYHDQTPIIIETNLQNIQIDWSYPNEILVIGGYRCINENSYENQVIFHTKQGDFLYRIIIPQTIEPFSALCWAHGKEIVFVACGTSLYTIWLTHQSLPSLLTLCQMKIKEKLLRNSQENLAQLVLPKNLQENLLTYYRSIIKGFLPHKNDLRSFVCYPLKSSLRLQCTMKRLDDDKDKTSSSSTTTGPIYILYLEYLGGLIPLLTAKRVSKICPDFIIFDPQMKTNQLEMKNSVNKFSLPMKNKFLVSKSRLHTFENIRNFQQINTNRSNLIYVAATEMNTEHEYFISEENSLRNKNHLHDQRTKRRMTMKENSNRLCTVAANIWGTRFKFYSHSTHLPEILGSVTYKTSLLHLQPRQMTVTVANNYPISQQQTVIEPIRSSSPTISITNTMRPFSPPCMQIKEASLTNLRHNHLSSPSILHTTTTTTTRYRHLPTLNSNKLSRSDPTLNQTKRSIVTKSIHQTILPTHQPLQSDNDDDEEKEEEDIESLSSDEEIIVHKQTVNRIEPRKHISPRHRLLMCTSGVRDSISSSQIEQVEEQNQSSFHVMRNRPPVWNEQSQVYQLDFGGRVTLESAKNFQIEFNGKQVIQFGRIENNCYTLDFEWPFSPLQAFAVALANITQRLK